MICAYLEKLHGEYLEKKISIDKTIANLELQLKENIEFIKILEESTDDIYESFSPRGINTKNRMQVDELRIKQKEILQEINDIKLQQDELVDIIHQNCNVHIVCIMDGSPEQEKKFQKSVQETLMEFDASTGQFYKGHLRSGQVLEFEQSVIIIGDVIIFNCYLANYFCVII